MKSNWNTNKSNIVIIGGIVISVLLIFTVVFFTLFGSKEAKKEGNQRENEQRNEETLIGDTVEMTAVYMEVDSSKKEITVIDVSSGEKKIFQFTGGTKITDKYEQLITVSQLAKGQVVKVYYLTDTKRIVQLSISGDIWENIGITDVKINKEAKIISYLGKNYSYGGGTVILSEGKVIPVDDLLSMDYLTIRGHEENIYSIVVTSGHGYLELAGGEQFIGGTIYVGSLFMKQITEDLRLTVPEGTHLVTVSNKKAEGSKEVVVLRNQTTICDVQEFGLEAIKTGLVQFKIYPETASLFIDKERKSFAEPISLTVGEHKIEVTLGGYVSYQGTLRVDEFLTTVSITLHENMSPTTSKETVTDDNQNGSLNNPINNDSNSNDSNSVDSNNENEQQSGNYSDNTSEGTQETETNTGETMTIKWTEGAEVFFNGEYVGVIKNGNLTVDKQIGNITVDLVIEGEDTITYDITVVDDGKNAVFSFPGR